MHLQINKTISEEKWLISSFILWIQICFSLGLTILEIDNSEIYLFSFVGVKNLFKYYFVVYKLRIVNVVFMAKECLIMSIILIR